MIEKPNVNINMTGNQYIKYLEYKKENLKFKFPKLSKNKKIALVSFMFSIVLSLFLIVFITNSTAKQPTPLFNEWYEAMPTMSLLSWNNIAKLSYLWCAPFLITFICISWLIHGVGFYIVR